MAKPVFTLVPDPERTKRVVAALTEGFDAPVTKTGVALNVQRIGRAKRKPAPVFVFDHPEVLGPDVARIRFNESATLRPIAWGKRDAVLGATVCAHLRDTMPANGKGLGVPWQWNPRVYVPRWVGWLTLSALVIASLAGMAR